MQIRNYLPEDHDGVIRLWSECFDYPNPHNNPEDSIRRKLSVNDRLFFVAATDEGSEIAGTVMAGWDGHRGWIYSMAVAGRFRKCGVGTALARHAIAALKEKDCPKINLQVMPDNTGVTGFYEKLGFKVEQRVSMGLKTYEPAGIITET